MKNESTKDYERRKNTNFKSIHNKLNIKCFLKVKCLEWADCVRQTERIFQKVLINNLIKY